jgi:hypothetical protein
VLNDRFSYQWTGKWLQSACWQENVWFWSIFFSFSKSLSHNYVLSLPFASWVIEGIQPSLTSKFAKDQRHWRVHFFGNSELVLRSPLYDTAYKNWGFEIFHENFAEKIKSWHWRRSAEHSGTIGSTICQQMDKKINYLRASSAQYACTDNCFKRSLARACDWTAFNPEKLNYWKQHRHHKPSVDSLFLSKGHFAKLPCVHRLHGVIFVNKKESFILLLRSRNVCHHVIITGIVINATATTRNFGLLF